jgi:hypothetical protein
VRREAAHEGREREAQRQQEEAARRGVGGEPEEEEQAEHEGEGGGEQQASRLDRTQQLQAARRTSELWAYTILQEEGLQLRQPCTVPLVEEVPFKLRQQVVRMYARCIGDLKAASFARATAEKGDDNAATELAKRREVGAWVIVLRVFPAAILRDYGGTGSDENSSRTMREMKAAIKLWNRGDYMGAYLRPTRDRARRRSRRAGGTTGVDQVVARAIRYAQEGRISRALQALEAAQLAPATDTTLRDIIALHPPRFVPTECPRRAAVTQQVAAARRTHGWKKLQWKHFHKAMQTMPRSVRPVCVRDRRCIRH